jgi:hypothetical protein
MKLFKYNTLKMHKNNTLINFKCTTSNTTLTQTNYKSPKKKMKIKYKKNTLINNGPLLKIKPFKEKTKTVPYAIKNFIAKNKKPSIY